MLGAGAASLTMTHLTFKTNTPLLAKMARNYEEYKANKFTRGQYDYNRRTLLNRLKIKLGPTNFLLHGTRTPHEVLRISRKKGGVPTQVMTQTIKRMGMLSKFASRGGVALSVVGLGVACNEIANTGNVQRKNKILVESLAGVLGGSLYGVTATGVVLMMATPAGWLAALVIGVGSVAASYSAGKLANNLYDTFGRKIDLASKTGVSQLCKK